MVEFVPIIIAARENRIVRFHKFAWATGLSRLQTPWCVPNDTTGMIAKGNPLVVDRVNGNRLWVVHSSGHGTVAGWINRSDVIPVSRAVDFFADELKRNPTAKAYQIHGVMLAMKGEIEMALGELNQAIRLNPKMQDAYMNRAFLWIAKQEYDKAIADCEEAIRLDPQYSLAYINRSAAWKAGGEYDRAISDLDEAIRLDPKDSRPWNGRAWIEATCPDPTWRNGKIAVEDATKACELSRWRAANCLEIHFGGGVCRSGRLRRGRQMADEGS